MIAGCEFGREGADDPDAGLDLGVGRIDDAEHGLAAGDQRQRRADTLRHREFRLRGLPGTELFQRRLGVFADRHRFHIGGGNPAISDEFGEIEAGTDTHIVDLGILRCNQHQAVAKQIDPGRLVDGLLLDRIIHPVGVRGDEHVGRRALLDLFCERRTGGVAGADLDAGPGSVGRVDVVERVLHRGGCEHGECLVLRSRG